MNPAPRPSLVARELLLFLASLIAQVAFSGCTENRELPVLPVNHSPVIDSLVAFPATIGPSDSTVVVCYAREPDGESLFFDWNTDARLNIKGTPTWNKYLNEQLSPACTFYNANLSNPINDSAWVYCGARDHRGGGSGRRIWVLLRVTTPAR